MLDRVGDYLPWLVLVVVLRFVLWELLRGLRRQWRR